MRNHKTPSRPPISIMNLNSDIQSTVLKNRDAYLRKWQCRQCFCWGGLKKYLNISHFSQRIRSSHKVFIKWFFFICLFLYFALLFEVPFFFLFEKKKIQKLRPTQLSRQFPTLGNILTLILRTTFFTVFSAFL